MSGEKILVVGNGMVGHYFVEKLRSHDANVDITVIGAEPRPAYDRVHLSSFFDGLTAADLALTTREHYKELNIEAHLGEQVVHIDRGKKQVETDLHRRFDYDNLVLATGSYPFVPPIEGADTKGCFVYRTIDDLGEIYAFAQHASSGVVVGGGLLGLEAANALKNLNLKTHVIEFAPGLMNVQLNRVAGETLQSEIETLGVQVRTEKNTTRINSSTEGSLTMEFSDGEELVTDMIVFSAGIRPHDSLADQAELEKGIRGGFIVNSECQTNDCDIYAIGECAAVSNQIFGLVAPGYRMADVVVSQLADGTLHFKGADMSTKLKLLGIDVGTIGDSLGRVSDSLKFDYKDERNQTYKQLVTDASCTKLLGATLVGDTSDYEILHQYVINEIALPSQPESLILPNINGGSNLLGVDALPASAIICSCHSVSKERIEASVSSGCHSVLEVKGDTAASSGCGGCAPLLQNLVENKLAELNIEVSNAICEHFPFSRQELYDIVRVEEIRTFKDLLRRHGTGLGCDICKPAVASMLASHWNEHILKDQHRGLQDTNDLYLGNMQKNGTYSIVPRVPGGEITPEKLIVLGQVAKEFDLYTKITGAQRIDLFGAEVHQLPSIWKRLIDAGFETGHAYGKALRTVKSCVGNTWCRYGVQDSVGMAIYLENRYKGLRSPHKIKMAVSGCTRECAEAQSKDVGVIATEKGWNLFVAGNGGMRPRHAELFATDLDDETLVKYIDRILMFYVRTADRLQRTSVWLEKLEGGIDYLRSVVIEDRLHLAQELEEQMKMLVDSYACEWKTTIEDPAKLKRFRHFVNSDEKDNTILFVRERGQKRPAIVEA